MHVIVYVSDAQVKSVNMERELKSICAIAKKNNALFSISGVLFYHNQTFLQLIEGERAALEGLMKILKQDQRHKNITRLVDEKSSQRYLPDWNMDTINLNNQVQFDKATLQILSELFFRNQRMHSESYIAALKSLLQYPHINQLIHKSA